MRIVAALVLALIAASLAAQTVAPAPPPAAKPTLAQLGLFIYPAKGQTPDQQKADETACTGWAETQTGLTASTGTVNTDAAAQAAKQQAAQQTQGAAVKGAAKGAVAGVAIGAIAGDAGQGAAIGAVAGAIGGRRQEEGRRGAGCPGGSPAGHPGEPAGDRDVQEGRGGLPRGPRLHGEVEATGRDRRRRGHPGRVPRPAGAGTRPRTCTRHG